LRAPCHPEPTAFELGWRNSASKATQAAVEIVSKTKTGA
jgi:hypothetical protein